MVGFIRSFRIRNYNYRFITVYEGFGIDSYSPGIVFDCILPCHVTSIFGRRFRINHTPGFDNPLTVFDFKIDI